MRARLSLLKALIRLVLAAMWLGLGGIGLMAPMMAVVATLPSLPAAIAMPLARGAGVLDLVLGMALLLNWRAKEMAILQLLLVAGYTLGLSILSPGLWLDPIGGLLKNLPVFALIVTHLALQEEVEDDAAAIRALRALRHYRLWFVPGWAALLGLVGVFWLMVAKPQFGA